MLAHAVARRPKSTKPFVCLPCFLGLRFQSIAAVLRALGDQSPITPPLSVQGEPKVSSTSPGSHAKTEDDGQGSNGVGPNRKHPRGRIRRYVSISDRLIQREVDRIRKVNEKTTKLYLAKSILENDRTLNEEAASPTAANREPDQEELKQRGTSKHQISCVTAKELQLRPIEIRGQRPVPGLSHGLERALFNPGIYHLQDPRSRVYNFDPFLEKIAPVKDFDFNLLSRFVPPSKDENLRKITVENGKKYFGSSSSMTSALAQFHFLLSTFRKVKVDMLSKAFPTPSDTFTKIQRSPTSIFLRWTGDSYAIDGDKEFDFPNLLSYLGQSLEKFLTLPKQEYERYKTDHALKFTEEERNQPETYHYTTAGDFLMRSQLDAHDARLPGTGMFDLKTRAVVSIRMDLQNVEEAAGYQIKTRLGEFESFEREFYDMIRAPLLKYSLQVRMGRMDGIFVAYHNTEKIFGFQYLPLPEIDGILHGTSGESTLLGDEEFKISLKLFNKVLDRATERFPQKSLRILLEAREGTPPFMYIFVEPVTEEQIEEIQNRSRAQMNDFEDAILGRSTTELPSVDVSDDVAEDVDEDVDDVKEVDPEGSEAAPDWEEIEARVEHEMDEDIERAPESHKTDEDFLTDSGMVEPAAAHDEAYSNTTPDQAEPPLKKVDREGEILAMTLTIRNKVNGNHVMRPENLMPNQRWEVDYNLAEVTTLKRAWSLYGACHARRKKQLDKSAQVEDGAEVHDYYVRMLRNLAREGRVWAARRAKMDQRRRRVILGQSNSRTRPIKRPPTKPQESAK